MSMTPRDRFLLALSGGMPDRIPMVIWNNKLLGNELDDQIFSLGVLQISKSCVWKMDLVGVDVDCREDNLEDGSIRCITIFRTVAGNLEMAERVLPYTVWIEKFPFSGEKDYDALEALIASRTYKPDFERFLDDDRIRGDQSLARPTTIHSPMHELIYEFMGLQAFSIEYGNNKEKLLHLAGVLYKDWEKRVEITASSPARYAVIEGNTEFSVVGPERFRKYYYPCIQKACEILHAKNILAGAHLDGNNHHLAPLIAETSLDFIESFTPYPETDLTITDAKQIWPDKALQIHFPSSVHLGGKIKIEEVSEAYLRQAAPGNGFIVGVSEDLPDRGVDTLIPFYRFFQERGKLPLTNKKKAEHYYGYPYFFNRCHFLHHTCHQQV